MDFELAESDRLIKETARSIARDVVAPRAKEVDETGETPHDYFEAFENAGLLGMAIPDPCGGNPGPASCHSASQLRKSRNTSPVPA